MKRTLRVKLRLTEGQRSSLLRTLALAAEVSALSASETQARDIRSSYDVQAIVYGRAKAMGLPAQIAVRAIRRGFDAVKTKRGSARNGRYGKPGSKRYEKVMSSPVDFRPDAALAFDDRCLSWQHLDSPEAKPDGVHGGTVSISSVDGRLKSIPFVGHPEHLELIARNRKGESDLVLHQGEFYLAAVIDEPTPEVIEPDGFLGVDLGIANIATTSTAEGGSKKRHSGSHVNRCREQNLKLRRRLQQKGTKSAKRLLKHRSKKESRFARNENHRISKQIVAEAKRTGHGIALENLKGLRARVRSRKPQRARLHSWAFAELAAFIAYKAERSGVPVIFVAPAYTSQQCSVCGYTDKKNRPNQETFACRNCGVSLHADENAAINIAQRGLDGWGAVNLPHAA